MVPLDADDAIPEGLLPVGHFAKDIEVSLIGDDGQPVGRGEVGEIVVKSRYVANGYWRDPKLTAERFSADLDGNGTRLVWTGDLGRINADGLLELCGRKDDRVKIRGNRIEVAEIDRALESFAGIDRAAVVAVRHENHEPYTGCVCRQDEPGVMDRAALAARRESEPCPFTWCRQESSFWTVCPTTGVTRLIARRSVNMSFRHLTTATAKGREQKRRCYLRTYGQKVLSFLMSVEITTSSTLAATH